jgi:hypothetical protein
MLTRAMSAYKNTLLSECLARSTKIQCTVYSEVGGLRPKLTTIKRVRQFSPNCFPHKDRPDPLLLEQQTEGLELKEDM